MIADEVVTGFGRLGNMFGSTHYGIEADFITIAKGLTSAYAPLSGSIVSDRVWKVLEQGTDKFGPIGHGWTYSAHPIGAAAGVANLKLLDELYLINNARKIGSYLFDKMRSEFGDHANVGEIRNQGLMGAVELVADRNGRQFYAADQKVGYQIANHMASKGVIARAMPQGDIIGFAPPFCLTEAEADQVVVATKNAIQVVCG